MYIKFRITNPEFDVMHVFVHVSRVPLYSRNWHDVVFRVIEVGVALWFPCVLWNCMRYVLYHKRYLSVKYSYLQDLLYLLHLLSVSISSILIIPSFLSQPRATVDSESEANTEKIGPGSRETYKGD